VGWFGRSESPAYSTLTWAFLSEDQAADLLTVFAGLNVIQSAFTEIRPPEILYRSLKFGD
jgi:hypothetical protein